MTGPSFSILAWGSRADPRLNEGHAFDLRVDIEARTEVQQTPRATRHARQQARAGAVLPQADHRSHLMVAGLAHAEDARRKDIDDGALVRPFAREADIPGENAQALARLLPHPRGR